jgi:putative glycosyltransferase (TIGR04348 family)
MAGTWYQVASVASIRIACPAPPRSRHGNRMTAVRWAGVLRSLGHQVRIGPADVVADADLLIALHARRSAVAIQRFRARHPHRPLVVALTGTDLYRDLRHSARARRSLVLADRLVLLQPAGRRVLPAPLQRKARVIYQSVAPVALRTHPPRSTFRVCVLAHLRAVKDPLLAARSVRDLPAVSRIRVVHAGRALTAALATRARAEQRRNPRYRWLGERSHRQALGLLAGSHVLVLSSRLEGGANVIGEAATLGVAILASRIDGTTGLLGRRYPGLFPVGDTDALRCLLLRAERDARFHAGLRRAVNTKAPLFAPARERQAWKRLVAELLE